MSYRKTDFRTLWESDRARAEKLMGALLSKHGGSVRETAEELGVTPKYVYRYLRISDDLRRCRKTAVDVAAAKAAKRLGA